MDTSKSEHIFDRKYDAMYSTRLMLRKISVAMEIYYIWIAEKGLYSLIEEWYSECEGLPNHSLFTEYI